MKKSKFIWGSLIALSLFGFTACDDDDNDSKNDSTTENTNNDSATENATYTAAIDNYVDNIVVPTYADLKEKAKVLKEKVNAMYEADQLGNLTDDLVKAAADQWIETREPWEESESFLFGPAATYNLDPSLDSWPLDKANINALLKSEMTFDGNTLGHEVRGFHTLEYLLFYQGSAKKASDFSGRELEYAVAVANILVENTVQLYYAWNGEVTGDDKELMDDAEIEMTGSFAERFKTPNLYDSQYKTQVDVIDQIVDGGLDISDEVGNQKIGGPYGNGNVEDVESWTSYHSKDDYTNNIISIQHSYMGTMSDDITDLEKVGGEKSISAIVAASNASLDNDIRAAIKEARNAIQGIPGSFANCIINKTGEDEIEAAMAACADLNEKYAKIKTVIK